MTIAPKTAAAAGAGSVSIALVEIIAWIVGYWNITIPPGVGASFATVFSVIASYYAPHHTPTAEEIKEIKAEPCDPPLQPPAPQLTSENWNTQQ